MVSVSQFMKSDASKAMSGRRTVKALVICMSALCVCVCVCECWKGGGNREGGVCYTRKTMPAALRSRMMLRYTCMNVNQRFRRIDFVETAGLFLAVVRPYVVDASSATDQRRSCSWKGGFPVLVQVLLLDIHILSSKVL